MKTHVDVARRIKKELLEMGFDKASVRSRLYSGGTSVDIVLKTTRERWIRAEVRRKLGKYCYGSYDGLTDSYVCDNVRKDVPQVRHIFVK